MKIEFKNSTRRSPDIKIAWINPCKAYFVEQEKGK